MSGADSGSGPFVPDWREDMDAALDTFIDVMALTGNPIPRSFLEVEYLPAPHIPPRSLPPGSQAVYAFWWNGEWLKVGKAGPRSSPRFASHHYNVSARSTLARSLINDLSLLDYAGLDPADPGRWIREHTSRVNILLPATLLPIYTSFLEAFLHLRLRPRYEG